MSRTIQNIPDFDKALDRDLMKSLQEMRQTRDDGQQAAHDRAVAARVEERSLAAAEVIEPRERFDATTGARNPNPTFREPPSEVANKWASLDATDLAGVKDRYKRDDVMNNLASNRERSGYYAAALRDGYPDVDAAVSSYERDQAARVAEKEARKSASLDLSAGDGVAAGRPAARDSEAAYAAAAATSMREEDRARLEAFASMKRQEALVKHPELQRAYDLQDASNAFRHEHLAHDKGASDSFAKMTDDFIRNKLVRNEPLPEVKRFQQEREQEQEIVRRSPQKSERVVEQELDR